ncbi:penicillin acylase family protein [Thalassolituus sp. LLYu03]|uniref:penicillin acylase family protein n=1 Tax=Thalassolituus sp. LLYu03 TaxID=3421656 RepID=UPI003D2E064E
MNNNKKTHGRALLLGLSLLSLTACTPVFDWIAERNLDAEDGEVELSGLNAAVSIRRDELGVPFIEADSLNDLSFGIGYAMAEDRLAQMVSMNLLARGRLSEMTGALALDMDIYMRTLGIPQVIESRYAALSPELKQLLQRFAEGVNAYVETHADRLPLELAMNGYTPEAWQPSNTLGLFVLLNLGVGFNLHEELAFLKMADAFGPEKAAYLAPVYPDEAIDFAEAQKLSGVLASKELSAVEPSLQFIQRVATQLKQVTGQGLAASNNWAVAPANTAAGKSLVANDTHLLLSQPSTWILMGVKSPEYSGVGITLPGIPAIVAGYNGHIGWGETMVMADTQDVFLEQLRTENGRREYRYQDAWYPVEERAEIIHVKGEDDVHLTVQSTRHGPLLNDAIHNKPKHEMIAIAAESEYGLALSWTAQYPDNTIDSFFNLGKAKTPQEAEQALNGVGFIHLNVIYGDESSVHWQVTGNYPQRKQGRGHFPSPGWSGDYDWLGYWGGADTPRVHAPASGYLGTGNNRTVEAGYEPVLTSSWYYPERSERIQQMLTARADHNYASMEVMQADRHDILLGKVQALWTTAEWRDLLLKGLGRLDEHDRTEAEQVLDVLLHFDGDMQPDSRAAAYWGAFEYQLIRAIFMDELGPEEGDLWQAFLAMNGRAYSGYQDHLLGRKTPDGQWAPFWDDVATTGVEQPGEIIARALLATRHYLQETLGKDDRAWQWGQLAFYHWKTETTHMLPYLSGVKHWAVERLADYTDRGPYPAGGNRNTLNVAGYDLGSDYEVWNIPAMRMIVDFSQDEPLHLVIAGGQSGNPASPHYDDGIQQWLSTQNRALPLNDSEKVAAHFTHLKQLKPKAQ